MSRLSALKEHTFMTALHAAGFPVPTPLAWNRHTVVMSLVEGTPLYQVRHLEEHEARRLYAELMDLIVRLARAGLIHGDFNEFNIMLEERESSIVQSHHPLADVGEKLEQDDERQDKITNVTLHPVLIDFPQMLSISHPNASTYFDRDVNCIKHYFSRRFHFTSDDSGPFFKDVERQMRQTKGVGRLDVEVEASGFSKKMAKELANYMNDVGVGQAGSDVDSVSDASEESESSDSRSRDTYDDHHHCETSSGHGHGFVVNRNLEASEVEEALSANQGSKHGSPKVAPTVSIESSVAESP